MKQESGDGAEACQLHGGKARSGDVMLICMVLASLSLIVWHVWVYGTSGISAGAGAVSATFPVLLGFELRDLLFGNRGIAAELWEVFPYFLAGILIAGYLRTFKIAVKLQRYLRKYGVMSVFLASFVGIITPLCACGMLTTAIGLLIAGIPLAPVMALMVTSPLMSPSTYLLTLNDLGPEWTVIRTLAAFSMGIFAGVTTHLISKRKGFGRQDIFIEGAMVRGDFHDDDYPDERLRCNCRRNFGNRVAVQTGNKFLVFLAKSSEMLWVVGKYVIVGVVLGAVVERYMPSEWIYRFFGRKDPLDIVWVTFASVPMFLHQISASSILHHIKGSLDGTLDGGAALAFMVGGPVTAVPTMALFWTFFKKRVFLLYMFVCLSGTLLIAYAFQLLLFVPGTDLGNPLLKGVASLSGGASGVIVKHGANVRMVMDPAGKGVIATYSNDIDGQGGIVFDASAGRFTGVTAAHYDNRNYVVNVARWLEQDPDSLRGKRILVCNLGEGTGAASYSPLGNAAWIELVKNGFTVRTGSGKDAPRISEAALADCSQLWLFFGNDGAKGLTDAELRLVEEHNARGRGVLVVPADPRTGRDYAKEANRLSSRYGVLFSGSVANSEELKVSPAATLLNRGSEWLGRVLKLVHKA
jgi:hypothetical protein